MLVLKIFSSFPGIHSGFRIILGLKTIVFPAGMFAIEKLVTFCEVKVKVFP
jgi:hypothetical protein